MDIVTSIIDMLIHFAPLILLIIIMINMFKGFLLFIKDYIQK